MFMAAASQPVGMPLTSGASETMSMATKVGTAHRKSSAAKISPSFHILR